MGEVHRFPARHPAKAREFILYPDQLNYVNASGREVKYTGASANLLDELRHLAALTREKQERVEALESNIAYALEAGDNLQGGWKKFFAALLTPPSEGADDG